MRAVDATIATTERLLDKDMILNAIHFLAWGWLVVIDFYSCGLLSDEWKV